MNDPTTPNVHVGPQVRLRYFIPYLLIFCLVPVGTYLFGHWLDTIFFLPPFPPFPFNILLGLSIMFSGAAIGIKATRKLRAAGKGLPWGELDKETQSTILVTTGIYEYTRNPILFGYTLLPFGMGLLFRSPGMALPIPLLILVIMVIWIKKKEEPNLESRFGKAYLEYKEKTPFLVPRLLPLILGFFTKRRKESENTQITS